MFFNILFFLSTYNETAFKDTACTSSVFYRLVILWILKVMGMADFAGVNKTENSILFVVHQKVLCDKLVQGANSRRQTQG